MPRTTAHDCKPPTRMKSGYALLPAISWRCRCGHRWRFTTEHGWQRVTPNR